MQKHHDKRSPSQPDNKASQPELDITHHPAVNFNRITTGQVVSPETVQILQRTIGNRRTSQLLLKRQTTAMQIQRYTTTNVYTFGGNPGDTLFSSQGMENQRPGANQLDTGYYRQDTRIDGGGGGLEQQEQEYQPAPIRGARGTWQDTGGAVPTGGNPQIRVSMNNAFAIEDTSAQPRVVFIAANMLPGINTQLQNTPAAHYIYLHPTGPSITVNGRNLVQVEPQLLDRATGALQNWADVECDRVASLVAGRNVDRGLLDTTANGNAPENENAQPHIGQTFSFRTRPGDNKTDRELGKRLPNQRKFTRKMREIAQQLDPLFDNAMKGIAVNMDNIGVKAKQFLPGWAEHFETVVAEDGNDRITLVNYNRATEKRTEQRRLLIHLLNTPAVETAFVNFVMQKVQANPDITWTNLVMTIIPQFLADPASQPVIDAVKAGLHQDIADMVNTYAPGMMYFSMYGQAVNQTFYDKFNPYSRGRGGEVYVL